jgi:lactoylglutathione lyase
VAADLALIKKLGVRTSQGVATSKQPIDPEKKPAVHTTPLNHVGLWIDKLPVAVEWLTAQGVRFAPGGIRPGAAGYDICFLHPKSNDQFPIAGEGVLIELVQAPPEVIAALG